MTTARARLRRRLFAWHGGRYAGGAVLCALVNNVILIGGARLGAPDLAGVLVAWASGGTIGYLWHCRLTFRAAPSWPGYLRFMSGTLLGIPLTWLLIALLRGPLGWPMEAAAPATTVILVVYNYLNARLAIRRKAGAAR